MNRAQVSAVLRTAHVSARATRSYATSASSTSSPAGAAAKAGTSYYKRTNVSYKDTAKPAAKFEAKRTLSSSSATGAAGAASSPSSTAKSNAATPSNNTYQAKYKVTTSSNGASNSGSANTASNSATSGASNGSNQQQHLGMAAKTFGDVFKKSLNDTPVLPENGATTGQGVTGFLYPQENGNSDTQQQNLPQQHQQHHNIDWINSFHGIGTTMLNERQIETLLLPLDPDDIEVKPDGLIYLPEIKYRRILNRALGPGAWGLIPRSDTIITPKLITREYALVVMGKLVSVARGEQDYFSEQGIPTATEGCKSNALMRCCKDLGIGSELWDPRFIRKFKKQYCEEKFVTHVTTGKKKKIWKRKDDTVEYPYKV